MYVCILSHDGEIVLHRNMKAAPEAFLQAVAPYREGLVVAVECIFTWYGLADLCAQESLPFILGHALYMKAIHGGKAKHDQIDSQKMAALLRGGMLPQAYVYPAKMRATRDLLRRCTHLMRKRSELLSHVQHTNSQYNLPEIGKNIAYKANREGVAERFDEAAVPKTIEVDLALITYYDELLKDLELTILQTAKQHDATGHQREKPEVSVLEAFPGCVLERPGTPRPFIPEPSRLIGHPLWLLQRRRWSPPVAWAAPPPSLARTGESTTLSHAY
jgi:hypothetical protein